MRFSLVSTIATLGSAVMAQPVTQLAARRLPVNAQDTLYFLREVTDIAKTLQTRAAGMDIASAPLDYPAISRITIDFDQQGHYSSSQQHFSDQDCTSVSDAYHTFAEINEAALDDLVAKAQYPTSLPFYEPMTTVLDSLRHAYAGLEDDLSLLYCPQSDTIYPDWSIVDQAISKAIDAYKV